MITIGTDTEVLLTKDGSLVSSIGLIGGTKENPFIVQGGNLQEDNVLAEFAIDPVTTEEEFITSIVSVMASLKRKIEPLSLGIDIKPIGFYSAECLNHPKSKEFGCEPDYSAYSYMPNIPPDPSMVGNMRSCGGHLHVGYPECDDSMDARPDLVKWMDILLGVPSVLLDDDRERRRLYGQAGAFRPKQYGIEYRVLSNFWIRSPELMRWAYRQTQEAYNRFKSGDRVESYIKPNVVEDTINGYNDKEAQYIIRELNVAMPV